MNSPLRILIAGGGTGGHIIPALAVARALVERHSAEILMVGTARGLESRLVPEAGFALKLIDVGPLKSVSMMTRIRTLLQLPRSIDDCKKLIREFRPDAVFGVGGYASGPAMFAALSLKIPTMAYEPNAMAGLANRLVGKRVQAASINFPAAAKWFRNSEVTGVPVRPEFFSLEAPTGPPHLLIFGGSQGARIFNTHLPQIIKSLLDAVPGLTVLHQSGLRNFEATQAAYAASGADSTRWQVQPFVDKMAAEFARAHLIMSRSGATTVAEEAAAGKPALLVPFAAATDEHQRRNAEAMAAAGAAVMLEERDLDIPDKLLSTLAGLLSDPARLATMSAAARTQAHPGAAERIADRLAELAGRERSSGSLSANSVCLLKRNKIREPRRADQRRLNDMDQQYVTVYEISNTPHVAWCFLLGVLPIVVALVLTFLRIRLKWGSPSWLSLALCSGFGVVWLIIGGFPGLNDAPAELLAYRQGHYQTVEGVITDYVPGLDSVWRKQMECFTVKETRFCYADDVVVPGFGNDRAHGGPIRAGQNVRIAYVPSPFSWQHNAILHLEIASNQIPPRRWF